MFFMYEIIEPYGSMHILSKIKLEGLVDLANMDMHTIEKSW